MTVQSTQEALDDPMRTLLPPWSAEGVLAPMESHYGLNEYQADAMRTAGQSDLVCAALGLAGESGEFADAIKKFRYHGHQLDYAHLIEEVGDVLWYCALAARELGVTLEDVANENVLKLQRRYPGGFSVERSVNR